MEKGLGHLFITLSSAHFFYETDLEQYLKNCIHAGDILLREGAYLREGGAVGPWPPFGSPG